MEALVREKEKLSEKKVGWKFNKETQKIWL